MKRLLAILLLCSSAWGVTAVTGTMQSLGGSGVTGGFVRFYLRGCAGNQPRVAGVGLVAPTLGAVFFFDFPANVAGQISGTLYSNRDSTGLLGGEIECGGSTTSTWYGMQAYFGGKGGPEVAVYAKNGSTIDISNVTPITVNPVVTAPTGDSTYLRTDAGNSPITGPLSLTSTETMTNAGTFTGASYTCYLCAAFGGWTPAAFTTVSLPNEFDGLSSGITIPAGAHVNFNIDAISGYVVNDADTRTGGVGNPGKFSNAASFFGISEAQVTGSSAWGANWIVSDATGIGNTFLVGEEIDMEMNGSPSFLYGHQVTLNGQTGTVPAGSQAYVINNNRTDAQKFLVGFGASDNCCSTALAIGTFGPLGPSVHSQDLTFARYDSGSVRHSDVFFEADASGNLGINVPTGMFVNMNHGLAVAGNLVFNTSLGQHITTSGANSDLAGKCVSGSGTTCTVSFTTAYTATPSCVITGLSLTPGLAAITTQANSGFVITYTNSGAATFNYICVGNPN